MRQSHFITGATGFVGSYLVIELLKQTQDTIYCLVRPREDQTPQDRLFGLLERIIPAYQEDPKLLAAARRRVVVVTGDLSENVLDVAKTIATPISRFWHVAASLNYEEKYAKQIFETNVMGTRYALRLAKQLKTECFNHFSTAYVVGKQEGIMEETQVLDTESNNAYERSKVTAENEVLATQSMRTRIFRPSVVIGHSQTGFAFNFSGIYGFMRRLVQFKALKSSLPTGSLDNDTVKMKIDPTVNLNLIPVDVVARESVQIGIKSTEACIFNITNPITLTVGECIHTFFRASGLNQPEIVDTTADFNWIDEKFNQKMEFYNSYLVGKKVFSRKHTDGALNKTANNGIYEITRQKLMAKCRWYVRLVEAEMEALAVAK